MLSGDKRDKAEAVSSSVGLDLTFSELSPEDKYNKLCEIIAESGNRTMYVGDGINDAPALALADVGISMGSIGQDSAIEASDVVIMTDNLLKIPEAILIARKTVRIAKQNIVFALGIKFLILILCALGLANMWLAVFADVGVAVIAILNSMRALRAPKLKERL
jgi:Cd2+/Zn2+-exporting ATPase